MKLYFEKQVKLLLEVLGTIADNPFFVLKGGTAINFFHSNLPRLSVDIDLTYMRINSREEFLRDNTIFWQALNAALPRKHAVQVLLITTKDGIPKQINVFSQDAEIKVEANLVLRGTIFPTVTMSSNSVIKEKYETKLSIQTLSQEELYAGKFCAALDRQHPRDLFDVLVFFEKHMLTEKFKKAFLIYLISANRPIAELINPHRLDQKQLYVNEFLGMTNREISYDELYSAREMLISAIDGALNEQDRQFLVSFKQGEPHWEHLGLNDVEFMPAIKWKLHNIKRMDARKRDLAISKLKQKLNIL